jgi:hypothetical protein
MGDVRYVVRVGDRGPDAGTVALQEGWRVTTDPVRTVLRGRLPDQAALLGILARVRLLGLELLEVRRLPPADDEHPLLRKSPEPDQLQAE